ncbi:MAG: general secretion pathway protein GspB [Spongiibacteraceae bacterium]
MSLILEALKKSEQQRQREKAPSLQSIHQPTHIVSKPARPSWWLLAVVVVSANIAILGYWFWRQQNTVLPTAQPAPAVSTAQPPSVENAAQSSVAAQNANAQAAPSENTQPEFTQISPRGGVVQSVPIDSAQRVEEIGELPDNVRNNLPAMTFSFHVYSDNPEQRTIIINDRRVREGEEISAGLTLQAITQDGVILCFQQHRIHISVLSDW